MDSVTDAAAQGWRRADTDTILAQRYQTWKLSVQTEYVIGKYLQYADHVPAYSSLAGPRTWQQADVS